MWKKTLPIIAVSALILVGCNNNAAMQGDRKNETPVDEMRKNNETPLEEMKEETHDVLPDLDHKNNGMENTKNWDKNDTNKQYDNVGPNGGNGIGTDDGINQTSPGVGVNGATVPKGTSPGASTNAIDERNK